MTVFFTSDTHFNHNNILTYCPRPWATVEEMNEGLIENWNHTVGPGDTVYHLGDFAMGDRTMVPNILSRLNGHIILVRGNHDYRKSLVHFTEVHDRLVVEVDGQQVELVHNPAHAQFQEGISFCGHVHEKWVEKKPGETIPADETPDHAYKHPAIVARSHIYNVGVDVRGYTPRTFREIVEG